MDMFEKAARLQLRFDSNKGMLTVEDLWTLPLTSKTGKLCLDDLARGLYQELQSATVVSFVTPRDDEAQQDLQLKFDIVKHIIDTLIAERDAIALQRERAEKKQQLLSLISQKENEALGARSLDELRAMLNSL